MKNTSALALTGATIAVSNAAIATSSRQWRRRSRGDRSENGVRETRVQNHHTSSGPRAFEANPAIDARAKARAGTTSDDLLDPAVDAYELAGAFTYEPRWTAAHFSFLRSFVRAMCMDSGEELRAADGGPEACPEAMRLLERMPDEPYAVNAANVTAARRDKAMLKGLSPTDLQTEWTKFFRRSYREAREAAERGE